jgi:hypothetical protein
MILSTNEIIERTNQIANGIYDNAHKRGKAITVIAAQELRIASMEAASRIMQGQVIAKVMDSKSFR